MWAEPDRECERMRKRDRQKVMKEVKGETGRERETEPGKCKFFYKTPMMLISCLQTAKTSVPKHCISF